MELEAHAPSTTPYTESPERAKSTRTPASASRICPDIWTSPRVPSTAMGANQGITEGVRSAITRGIMGATRYHALCAPLGMKLSLVKSLMPSGRFCTNPKRRMPPSSGMLARLGPNRSWMRDAPLRSMKMLMGIRHSGTKASRNLPHCRRNGRSMWITLRLLPGGAPAGRWSGRSARPAKGSGIARSGRRPVRLSTRACPPWTGPAMSARDPDWAGWEPR